MLELKLFKMKIMNELICLWFYIECEMVWSNQRLRESNNIFKKYIRFFLFWGVGRGILFHEVKKAAEYKNPFEVAAWPQKEKSDFSRSVKHSAFRVLSDVFLQTCAWKWGEGKTGNPTATPFCLLGAPSPHLMSSFLLCSTCGSTCIVYLWI